MKKNISLWQLGGFAFAAAGGTLLHFLYEWSGQRLWAAPFSGVNESTWEHMKLLFVPLFVFALLQRRFWREENFWCVKLAGILTGLTLIPLLFYTYNGAIGKSPDWLNIALFFVAAAGAFFVEARLFRAHSRCRLPRLAFGLICLIGVLFVVFTFFPPHLPLFRDPLTGAYGLLG